MSTFCNQMVRRCPLPTHHEYIAASTGVVTRLIDRVMMQTANRQTVFLPDPTDIPRSAKTYGHIVYQETPEVDEQGNPVVRRIAIIDDDEPEQVGDNILLPANLALPVHQHPPPEDRRQVMGLELDEPAEEPEDPEGDQLSLADEAPAGAAPKDEAAPKQQRGGEKRKFKCGLQGGFKRYILRLLHYLLVH